mgnify:CR=1 FL=1
MGQAIRGTIPSVSGTSSEPTCEVERLKGEALKVYLQYKLRELEEQITVLSQLCERTSDPEPGNAPQPTSPQPDDWELFLDLSYLCATRDAIISALNIL